MTFSFEEIDVIKESLNIGIGKSANALSEIFNEFIQVEVPDIRIDTFKNAKKYLKEKFNNHISVYQNFLGDINGKSYVLFPRTSINSILSSIANEEVIDSDLINDILMELSNILINNLTGAIAEFLNESIEYSLPEIDFNKFDDLIDNKDYFLVIINTILKLKIKNIDLNVLIIFSIKSFDKFKQKLLRAIEKND